MDIDRPKRELRIRKLLNDAVDHKGFEVFYQPIYSVAENRIVSAEALVRLKDQSMGYISPEEFIPIAEKSGMIMQIGEFVFETVCRFIQEKQLTVYRNKSICGAVYAGKSCRAVDGNNEEVSCSTIPD